MLKFAANLRWLFTEVPMLERYAASAAAGFKGVETAFPFEFPAAKVAQLLADNGLTMVQMVSPFDWDKGERGIAALPGRQEEFRKSLRFAVEYGLQIGRPMIHVMPGNIDAGMNREECMAIFVENMAWAADLAKAEGTTLTLEPCCAFSVPHLLYHRVGEAASVIKTLNRDNVRICFDTFHIQVEEGALTHKLHENYPYIGHVQIANSPNRNEPGTGELCMPFFFEQLEKLGWDRWIGCEYKPPGRTEDSLAWGRAYGLGR
ncbi:MAG: hypothetical protein JWP36_2390 [Paucimonas sp.]|nr:hypothetical protein [Paucimonas sp.]